MSFFSIFCTKFFFHTSIEKIMQRVKRFTGAIQVSMRNKGKFLLYTGKYINIALTCRLAITITIIFQKITRRNR